MNIYREVVNRIEIPALPSLESGYYLLRFERNGTASNVYCVVENESGMGVPITASLTEIGTGTPDPEASEVLLAPGAWTLFFYEQVSGTNTNPDCSTIPLGQTEVTVYGEDAAVLSQTPTTCPSGPGGGITSVNGDTGPAVQLDAVDIPVTPYATSSSGSFPTPEVFKASTIIQSGKPIYKIDGSDIGDTFYAFESPNTWTAYVEGNRVYEATSTASTPWEVTPGLWTAVGGGVAPTPTFIVSAADVQAELERQNAATAALQPGYTMIRGLITQTGTDAPTMTVLENTLGGVPVWTYNNPGSYFLTLSGAFAGTVVTDGKYATTNDGDAPIFMNWFNDTANRVVLIVATYPDGNTSELEMTGLPFTIYVYP